MKETNRWEKTDNIKYGKEAVIRGWLLPALFSFAGVWALPFALFPQGKEPGYTNSMAAFLLFAALTAYFKKLLAYTFEGRKWGWFLPGIFGFLFSLCMVFGAKLDSLGSVPFQSLSMWAAVLILGALTGLSVRYAWERWGKHAVTMPAKSRQSRTKSRELIRTAGIIWLCYFPVFLAVYPGFFVYDAQDELLQVVTRNFSTHHPLLHVLLMGGIVQLFHKLTGSYNLGIACYTLFQMTVMAGIFAYCVAKLKSKGLSRAGQILLTLYFGLCPVLVMFSLCSAKDGLFMGMLLIMVLLVQELCREPDAFFKNGKKLLAYGAAGLCMMLLRHNGFYAFLVFIPILTVALKGRRLKAFLYQAVIAAAYLLASGLLTAVLHADASENQEILTVPISQLARVYASEKDSLPEEEKEILFRYLPKEGLESYTPKVTDSVKVHFSNQAYEQDKGGFLALWLKWGMENPFTYANAWLMTSYGFWYPDTVIDVYRGNTVFTFTYEDSSYFGYEVEEPGIRESRLPWLNELYRRMSLEVFVQKIPVVSMLFSPGFLFWVMAFCMGYLLYSRQFQKALPFTPLFLCFLTVLFGPTYLVRYVVYWWAALPVLVFETVYADI